MKAYLIDKNNLHLAMIGAILTIALLVFYVVYEPVLVRAAEDQFTISQSVTAELSFSTPATDVTMSPAIAGITGGTSNGGTQIIVNTNNSTGYTMTMTSSSSPAMQGDSQGGTIPDYVPSTVMVPDFTFSVPAATGEFGYTVEASTTADVYTTFKDDGGACNTGALNTADSCWLNASTTAETIINRSSATPASGATTTIKFRITINSNPIPAIDEDTYTATTTLTATTN